MITDLNCFVEDAYKKQSGLGANPSVFRRDKDRKMPRSLGQDECIFKQYLLHQKTWQSKDGHFRIHPKDDDSGLMTSGFQGREFGFGFSCFNERRDKINEHRRGYGGKISAKIHTSKIKEVDGYL
eukprot:304398-Ditylum_brightwellii.AAC.1